jgi:predicted nucleic acid-binding protein
MVPLTLCDTLLRAAEFGIYEVRWSDAILAELRRTLAEKLSLGQERAQRRIDAQRAHFPNALVHNFEPLIERMTNHPKDRHVLAAAVSGGAESIVTFNLRDFPERALTPWRIVAESPDHFLSRLCTTAPETFNTIVAEQAADVGRSREQVLARLARDGVPTFVQLLRAAGNG